MSENIVLKKLYLNLHNIFILIKEKQNKHFLAQYLPKSFKSGVSKGLRCLGWTSTHVDTIWKKSQNPINLFPNITNMPCLD
jgi:hypothetical protein